MIDPDALTQLHKATRDCPDWQSDPSQLNIKTADPYLLPAFRALAWLMRETHADLLARLVSEEIEFLAARTAVLAPQVRPPRKVARTERPAGTPTLDELADGLLASWEDE